MKVFHLNNNLINIQKCFMPESLFLKENYGKHCLINSEGINRKIMVRILLNENINTQGIYLDESVFTVTKFEDMNDINSISDVNFNSFVILKKPVTASRIKVMVIFADIFSIQNYKSKPDELRKLVHNILKMIAFCESSVISLKKFFANNDISNINFLVITEISNSAPGQSYEVDSNTQITITKCICQLKFDQLHIKSNIEIGGCQNAYEFLEEVVESINNNLFQIKKLLIVGPNGCGKKNLVYNVSKKYNCIVLEISAADIISESTTDCEVKLKQVLSKAEAYSKNNDNCIILITDVDLLCGGKSYSKKIIKLLIDSLNTVNHSFGIIVIATAASVENVDVQLRARGMFEDEIEITVPTVEERKDILKKILKDCNLHVNSNVINKVANVTPGFVGADLKLLITETLILLYKEQTDFSSDDSKLLEFCFKQALTKVIPSTLRGTLGLVRDKNLTFSEIGGLEDVKNILNLSVSLQLKNPEVFQKLGIPLTKGILLYGPPGCAKTTLVRAIAEESNATFLATSAADLYSPFVGDAEKRIVKLFHQARIGSPTILFIDEIDAVVGNKSGDRERGVQERILSTLLVEMDGFGIDINYKRENPAESNNRNPKDNNNCDTLKNKNSGVIVIGATNHPHLLDDALKRPGRFDKLIYIPPPDESERVEILKKVTKKMKIHDSINFQRIAELTEFYSGADLKNLCQESGLYALKSTNMTADSIHQSHFESVLNEFRPSLNQKLIDFYESFKNCRNS